MGTLCEALVNSPCHPVNNVRPLCEGLDLGSYVGYSEAAGERIKRAAANEWSDSGEMVGVYGYYFDNELVAFSFQNAYGNRVDWMWRSKDCALKVRAFLQEIDSGEHIFVEVYDPETTAVGADWLDGGSYPHALRKTERPE